MGGGGTAAEQRRSDLSLLMELISGSEKTEADLSRQPLDSSTTLNSFQTYQPSESWGACLDPRFDLRVFVTGRQALTVGHVRTLAAKINLSQKARHLYRPLWWPGVQRDAEQRKRSLQSERGRSGLVPFHQTTRLEDFSLILEHKC